MSTIPPYTTNPFVQRERIQSSNRVEADFDPRIINSWLAARFRQLTLIVVLPFITFVWV